MRIIYAVLQNKRKIDFPGVMMALLCLRPAILTADDKQQVLKQGSNDINSISDKETFICFVI